MPKAALQKKKEALLPSEPNFKKVERLTAALQTELFNVMTLPESDIAGCAKQLADDWCTAQIDPTLPMQSILERVQWQTVEPDAIALILSLLALHLNADNTLLLRDAVHRELGAVRQDLAEQKLWELVHDATKNDRLATEISQKAREAFA